MPSYYPLRVFTTILIYWLGYQSIVQLKVSEERKYLREYLLSKSKFADNSEVISPKEVNSTNRGINISEEIIDNVLKGLNEFENKKDYIQPNINLQVLAKKLDTNTNYLSKIINHYKGVSFTIYLNSLRIENIIKELKANPKIRKFTIKAIAQEAGFNNSDSFSKVFFKLKGENPSEFIKKLD
jgi:YesN/AraC family two-component response regulator